MPTYADEHFRIWAAIDHIAFKNGVSVSALARRAGLDATAFNKSKRAYASGKHRWPSTESVVKVLHASSLTWAEFSKLLDDISAAAPEEGFKKAA